VNATVDADAEVAPNVRSRLEIEPFDGTGRGLEALVGILGRDVGGDNVRLERLVIFVHEIDGGGRVHVPPEKRRTSGILNNGMPMATNPYVAGKLTPVMSLFTGCSLGGNDDKRIRPCRPEC
jgi:hypothetical protein